jgi:hypothetical protein
VEGDAKIGHDLVEFVDDLVVVNDGWEVILVDGLGTQHLEH